jgi:hypothetical protein
MFVRRESKLKMKNMRMDFGVLEEKYGKKYNSF